jgi:hypothetical protein
MLQARANNQTLTSIGQRSALSLPTKTVRRDVYKVAVAYTVVAWLVIQVRTLTHRMCSP